MNNNLEELNKMKQIIAKNLSGILLDANMYGYSDEESLMFFIESLIDASVLKTMLLLEESMCLNKK